MVSLFKTERVLRSPGVFKITLGGILSICLGVVLASVYLIFKPVATVQELPKEPVFGTVYYVQGSTDMNKVRQWQRKRQMLSEGATADITFSEEELNAWIASVVPQAANAKAKPGLDSKPDDQTNAVLAASRPLMVVDRPNFRIRDNVLQVALPTTVHAFGFSLPLILQVRGHFDKGANSFVFVTEELYCGSFPAHRVPGLKNLIVARLLAAQDIPGDLRTAWEKLILVAVAGNTLRFSLP